MPPTTTHGFTITLLIPTAVTPKFMDALHSAGCDDTTVFQRDGRVLLRFSRDGETVQDAIWAAIRDVERAGGKVAGARWRRR